MSSKRNTVIYILFGIIFIACFVFYAILSKEQKYKKIVYNIEYPSDTLFTEKEFDKYVSKVYSSIIGNSFDSVNLSELEKKIEKYPYISNADVINNRGTMLIKATQDKIIAKIFNNRNEQFLLAESGKLVPKTKNTAGRIIAVNGYISKRYVENYFVYKEDTPDNKNKSKYSPLNVVWRMAIFIEQDPFWKAQISQIYINEKQEVELIPTIGNHVVLFGSINFKEDMDLTVKQRMNNLKHLYIDGFKITGWNRYKSINLKYGTEIPCRKKNNNP
jgi:cell division protein FtsQ